jgi:hypothetical protein
VQAEVYAARERAKARQDAEKAERAGAKRRRDREGYERLNAKFEGGAKDKDTDAEAR